MKDKLSVATAVVRDSNSGKFLAAKRTQNTDIHPGKWDFPSGKIEEQDKNTVEAAKRELEEETKIKAEFIREGDSFTVKTDDGVFKVHPVLFETSEDPELNSEHTAYQWIVPKELDDLDTVKGLKTDLENVGVGL